jgi:hypothetical protein
LGAENHNWLMKRRGLGVAGLLCASLLTTPAEGKSRFDRVTIVEEGSTTEIRVTDVALLDFFSFSRFPEQLLAESPEPATKAYVVTRGHFTPDGVFQAFDRLRYYPSDSAGHSGFVYYDGLVSGRSEYDQKWYTASPEGDRAMKDLIAAHFSPAKANADLTGLPPNNSFEQARHERRAD